MHHPQNERHFNSCSGAVREKEFAVLGSLSALPQCGIDSGGISTCVRFISFGSVDLVNPLAFVAGTCDSECIQLLSRSDSLADNPDWFPSHSRLVFRNGGGIFPEAIRREMREGATDRCESEFAWRGGDRIDGWTWRWKIGGADVRYFNSVDIRLSWNDFCGGVACRIFELPNQYNPESPVEHWQGVENERHFNSCSGAVREKEFAVLGSLSALPQCGIDSGGISTCVRFISFGSVDLVNPLAFVAGTCDSECIQLLSRSDSLADNPDWFPSHSRLVFRNGGGIFPEAIRREMREGATDRCESEFAWRGGDRIDGWTWRWKIGGADVRYFNSVDIRLSWNDFCGGVACRIFELPNQYNPESPVEHWQGVENERHFNSCSGAVREKEFAVLGSLSALPQCGIDSGGISTCVRFISFGSVDLVNPLAFVAGTCDSECIQLLSRSDSLADNPDWFPSHSRLVFRNGGGIFPEAIRREMREGATDRCGSEFAWRGGDRIDGWTWRWKIGGADVRYFNSVDIRLSWNDFCGGVACRIFELPNQYNPESPVEHWQGVENERHFNSCSGAVREKEFAVLGSLSALPQCGIDSGGISTCVRFISFGSVDLVNPLAFVAGTCDSECIQLLSRSDSLADNPDWFPSHSRLVFRNGGGIFPEAIRREMREGATDRCESEFAWRGGDRIDGWTWRWKIGGADVRYFNSVDIRLSWNDFCGGVACRIFELPNQYNPESPVEHWQGVENERHFNSCSGAVREKEFAVLGSLSALPQCGIDSGGISTCVRFISFGSVDLVNPLAFVAGTCDSECIQLLSRSDSLADNPDWFPSHSRLVFRNGGGIFPEAIRREMREGATDRCGSEFAWRGGDRIDGWTWRWKIGGADVRYFNSVDIRLSWNDFCGGVACRIFELPNQYNPESPVEHWQGVENERHFNSCSGAVREKEFAVLGSLSALPQCGIDSGGISTCVRFISFGSVDLVNPLAFVAGTCDSECIQLLSRSDSLADNPDWFPSHSRLVFRNGGGIFPEAIRREMREGATDRCESEFAWRGGDRIDGWTWRWKIGGADVRYFNSVDIRLSWNDFCGGVACRIFELPNQYNPESPVEHWQGVENERHFNSCSGAVREKEFAVLGSLSALPQCGIDSGGISTCVRFISFGSVDLVNPLAFVAGTCDSECIQLLSRSDSLADNPDWFPSHSRLVFRNGGGIFPEAIRREMREGATDRCGSEFAWRGGDRIDGWTWRWKIGGADVRYFNSVDIRLSWNDFCGGVACRIFELPNQYNPESPVEHWQGVENERHFNSCSGAVREKEFAVLGSLSALPQCGIDSGGISTCVRFISFGSVDLVNPLAFVAGTCDSECIQLLSRSDSLADNPDWFPSHSRLVFRNGGGIFPEAIRREMREGATDRCGSEFAWRGGDRIDGWTWRWKIGGAVSD
ncbi:hypothetical protein C8R47DRAFT_1083574 [Mycena vitilis]|nr:hypothetical protein C8R47DRAFT_1083574 [Mycena vitilis]